MACVTVARATLLVRMTPGANCVLMMMRASSGAAAETSAQQVLAMLMR